MTISNTVRTAGPFLGAGTTALLPFGFKVFLASDLLVVTMDASLVQTRLVLSSDYTVSLNGDQNAAPGGVVQLLAPLASGSTAFITSNIAITQPLRLTNAGGFFPQNIEDEFDRLTILLQQTAGGQILRVPVGEMTVDLPAAAVRAGHLMGFDSTGQPVALVAPDADGATALDLAIRNATLGAEGVGQVGYNPALAYTTGLGRFLGTVFGRTAAETAAGVTPTNYGYAPGHAYRYGTNTTPGTTDMTAALNATLLQAYQTGGADPFWPGQTLLVTSLTITASVSVRTSGFATVLKQKSGQPSDTHILNITASGVTVGDFAATGNIASDVDEYMHAVVIGGASSISGVKLGDVKGTNIRGDVVYLGGTIANPLFDVTMGNILGTNIYRNVVAFVGVEGCAVRSISGTQIGYRLFDIEPNAGSSQAPTGIHIGWVRGANMQFAGDASMPIGSVRIDYADMDNSLSSDSTPGYPTHPGASANLPIIAHHFQSIYIGALRARGCGERLINATSTTTNCTLVFENVDISGCNTTETVYKALANIDEYVDLRINAGSIVLAGVDRYVVKGNAGTFSLSALRISGGSVAGFCTGGRFTGLTINASGLASNLFGSCVRCTFEDVSITNGGAATLLVNSTINTLDTVSGALGTVEGSGCSDNQARNSQLSGIWYGYDRLGGHVQQVAMSDSNQTLTGANQAGLLVMPTGALTAQRNLFVPNIPRVYTVVNGCTGFGVQMIGPTGTGIVVGVAKRAMVLFDGTNVVRLTADI